MPTSPYTHHITRLMFLETADENYILSRTAFFNQLYVEFFWQGLHALEKYMKAVLLFNDRSAKGQGHNLQKLIEEVRALLHPNDVGVLRRPDQLPADFHWHEETLGEFLDRFASNGDPNNRYMAYGFAQFRDDLLKLDQAVWLMRRFARPLRQVLGDGEDAVEVDMAAHIAGNPDLWWLHAGLVEKALHSRPAKAGGVTKELRANLLRQNLAFAPDQEHDFRYWQSATASHPLSEHFGTLEHVDDPAEVAMALSAIDWMLDNVHLSKPDIAAIKAERDRILGEKAKRKKARWQHPCGNLR